MCNYTIAFFPKAPSGTWGESFVLSSRFFSHLTVEFKKDDVDDNRGSGR
jgi:hypothetical protein